MTNTISVDQKTMTDLIKLYKAYQADNPISIVTDTQSFAGFMYWLEQKVLVNL